MSSPCVQQQRQVAFSIPNTIQGNYHDDHIITSNKSVFLVRQTSLTRSLVSIPLHNVPSFSKLELKEFPSQPFPANFTFVEGQGWEKIPILKAFTIPVSNPPIMLDHAFTYVFASTPESREIMQGIRKIEDTVPTARRDIRLLRFSKLTSAWLLPRTSIYCTSKCRS